MCTPFFMRSTSLGYTLGSLNCLNPVVLCVASYGGNLGSLRVHPVFLTQYQLGLHHGVTLCVTRFVERGFYGGKVGSLCVHPVFSYAIPAWLNGQRIGSLNCLHPVLLRVAFMAGIWGHFVCTPLFSRSTNCLEGRMGSLNCLHPRIVQWVFRLS